MHLFRKWFRVAEHCAVRPSYFFFLSPGPSWSTADNVIQRMKYIGWSTLGRTQRCFFAHERTTVAHALGMKIKEANNLRHNPKYHFIHLFNLRVRSQSALIV